MKFSFILFFLSFFFFGSTLISAQSLLNESSNCDPDYLRELMSKDISVPNGTEYFNAGVCEFNNKNFEKAYNYFLIAKSKGYNNEVLMAKYFLDAEKAIDSISKVLMDSSETDKGHDSDMLRNISITALKERHDYRELLVENFNHTLQVNFFNVFFGFSSLVGFLLAGYLLVYARSGLNYLAFLAIFVLAISLAVLELALFWFKGIAYHPKVPFYRVLFFLWAPSFYLYIKDKFALKVPSAKRKGRLYIHYAAFFIAFIALWLLGNYQEGFPGNIFFQLLNLLVNDIWIKGLHLTFYLGLLVILIRKYGGNLYQSEKKGLIVLLVFFVIILLSIYTRAAFRSIHSIDYVSMYFIAVFFSIFIISTSIIMFLHPKLLTNTLSVKAKKDKYRNSGLTDTLATSLRDELVALMLEKKVYLDHELTLTGLSDMLNTDRYSLSQVINQEFAKNYYEFINDYRIQQVLRIIDESPSDRLGNLIDIAYEAGFGNRVSFNKAFKKRTDMTPSEYLVKVKKH